MAPPLRVRVAWLTTAAVLVGLVLVYAGRWQTGFYYDDYHFVRPALSLELRRVWFGSWDPTGIESVFFRPLTAWLFAGRFAVFGLNDTALHLASLVGHGVCALLVGWFVRREAGPAAGALAAWVYAIHPAMPYAQVSWLTNQMHLAESILVLLALLAWQRARGGSRRWWIAVFVLAVVAFFIKEDAVMLLPVVVGLDLLDHVRARRWPGRRWVVVMLLSVLVAAALVLFRFDRLGVLGGYGVPTIAQAGDNLLKGPLAVAALWPSRNPWRAVSAAIALVMLAAVLMYIRPFRTRPVLSAAALATLVLLAWNLPSFALPRADDYPLWTIQGMASGVTLGLFVSGTALAWWRRDWPLATMIGIGVVVLTGFDLPFALVTKREQYHLLALGSVIMWAGAFEAWRRAVGPAPARSVAVIAVLVAATLPSAVLARQNTLDFAPCAPAIVDLDQGVRGWWVVPDELKGWIDQKVAACKAGQPIPSLGAIDVVSWGVFESAASGENGGRWTSDRAVFAITPAATAARISLRRADASASHPVRVAISGGATPAGVALTSPDWTTVSVPLRAGFWSSLRRRHHLYLRVEDWFVPAVLDFRATDLRRHGVEYRVELGSE